MIINSRSRVSNLLFSNSCINWLNATLATPGLLATTRNASLWVRRAGIPIASPSSRARSGDTIGTRKVIVCLLAVSPIVLHGARLDKPPAKERHSRDRREVREGHAMLRSWIHFTRGRFVRQARVGLG